MQVCIASMEKHISEGEKTTTIVACKLPVGKRKIAIIMTAAISLVMICSITFTNINKVTSEQNCEVANLVINHQGSSCKKQTLNNCCSILLCDEIVEINCPDLKLMISLEELSEFAYLACFSYHEKTPCEITYNATVIHFTVPECGIICKITN